MAIWGETKTGFIVLGIIITTAIYGKITGDLRPLVAFGAVLLAVQLIGVFNEVLGKMRGE